MVAELRSLMSSLDLVEGDVRRASLTFSITLFTDRVLSDIPAATLRCQEIFLKRCPQDALRFYATENMRRHRPVTKKTLTILPARLETPSAKPEYIVLELKDGERPEDAPKHFFKVVGSEKGSIGYKEHLANAVCLAFPPGTVLEDTDRMLQMVVDLCEEFPFQSGNAGFAFHCSRYEAEPAESHAVSTSMRYPEIDIVRLPKDIHAVAQNAVKTIGWITLVGENFIDQLGGIAAVQRRLGRKTSCTRVNSGYLVRIGDKPTLSDRNRNERCPDYTLLYEALKPLIDVAADQSQWFVLGGSNRDEQTRAWYRRFEE
jgi:hypothetical protein